MPATWSTKDERQYRAIKASCLRRDARRTRICPRMAAATVNKQRRKEGRTLDGLDQTLVWGEGLSIWLTLGILGLSLLPFLIRRSRS